MPGAIVHAAAQFWLRTPKTEVGHIVCSLRRQSGHTAVARLCFIAALTVARSIIRKSTV